MKKTLDYIECPKISEEIIVYRFPMTDKEIRNGAQLVVKEGQNAVLVSEGKVGEVFGPGKYKLKEKTIPIIADINKKNSNFKSYFSADVYFVSDTYFSNIKWGTANPVIMRDDDFGMIKIRAFGSFAFHVDDAGMFVQEIFATVNKFSVDNISSYLKAIVISGFTDMIADTRIDALELAEHYGELSKQTRERLNYRFTLNGLNLDDLIIENISLPEEVENKIHSKSTTKVVKGVIEEYAKNASAAQVDTNLERVAETAAIVGDVVKKTQPGTKNKNMINCPSCKESIPKGSAYCPYCGKPNRDTMKVCSKCGSVITFDAKFCPDCGEKLYESKDIITCKKCGKTLRDTDKFCPDCGTGA